MVTSGIRVLMLACVFAVAAVLLIPEHAHAAASAGTLDEMLDKFQTASSSWGGALRKLALDSFFILALVDLAWTAISWAFRGTDLGDLLGSLVTEIMFLGIFLALLENSVSWSQDIVNSFREGAAAAGAPATTPSAIVAAGVNVAKEVTSISAVLHPIDFVAFMIAAIVILICFAGIAALMIAVLVESFLVIQASVLLMAFGGSRWTKDVAVSAIKYAVAVGAKLMILQFITALGTTFTTDWATGFNAGDNTSVWLVIACSIVLLAVSKIVPDTFMRLVGGASLASGAALMATAGMVGAGVAGGMLGGAGYGAAALNAFRLAGSQMTAKEEAERNAAAGSGGIAPQRSRLARAATMSGYATKSFGGAITSDIGGRLSGQARAGRASWRMASNIAQQNRNVRGP